jgi:hypothetical protein
MSPKKYRNELLDRHRVALSAGSSPVIAIVVVG